MTVESPRLSPIKHAPEERDAVARQLRNMRNQDRKSGYTNDRNQWDYFHHFSGLMHLFQYAKRLSGSKTVLDIGAGNTQAIFSLSQIPETQELHFLATSLTMHPCVDMYLGHEKVHLTSASVLRGISDESIAVALACYSVTYSASPKMSCERIDQVLIPGGVFKGVFRGEVKDEHTRKCFDRDRLLPPDIFAKQFVRLGYSIALQQASAGDILLAIKPGGNEPITAQQLLESDRKSYAPPQPLSFSDSSLPDANDLPGSLHSKDTLSPRRKLGMILPQFLRRQTPVKI